MPAVDTLCRMLSVIRFVSRLLRLIPHFSPYVRDISFYERLFLFGDLLLHLTCISPSSTTYRVIQA